jgi:hypothetical protein
MSLTSYRAAPPRAIFFRAALAAPRTYSSAYITEAKRPLEGGLLFGWAGG